LLYAVHVTYAALVAGIFLLCDIGAFEYGAILPRLYLPLIIRN
jgi:hypothetical protein